MTTTNYAAETFYILTLRAEIAETMAVAVDVALEAGAPSAGFNWAVDRSPVLASERHAYSATLYTVCELFNHVQGSGTAQYDHSRRWGGFVHHVQDNLTRVTTHLLDGEEW
jgi:hypothetical protein